MEHGLFLALAGAAISVGALHTLAPDHWLPFAALARAQGWSAGRTARVTFLCGFGHVTVSALFGLLGLFFALPMALVTAAVYVTWTRGSAVKRSDTLLWVAFVTSVVIGALPVLGLFGVGLLPASLVLLADRKPAGVRIALGALLVVATLVIVFAVPVLFFPAAAPTS